MQKFKIKAELRLSKILVSALAVSILIVTMISCGPVEETDTADDTTFEFLDKKYTVPFNLKDIPVYFDEELSVWLPNDYYGAFFYFGNDRNGDRGGSLKVQSDDEENIKDGMVYYLSFEEGWEHKDFFSYKSLRFGSTKEEVRKVLGEPTEESSMGDDKYQLDENELHYVMFSYDSDAKLEKFEISYLKEDTFEKFAEIIDKYDESEE